MANIPIVEQTDLEQTEVSELGSGDLNNSFNYHNLISEDESEEKVEEMPASDDIRKINADLNKVFENRILDIELQTPMDLELKLQTHQEWLDILLKTNELLTNNMEAVHLELDERLANHLDDANCELHYRQDIESLVKFIRKAFHCGHWNTDELEMKTRHPLELLMNESDDLGATSEDVKTKTSSGLINRKKRAKGPYTKTATGI